MISNIVLLTVSFLLFAIIHSLMAGHTLRLRLTKILSPRLVEGWYRFFYNVVSVLTVAPVFYAIIVLPTSPLYTLGGVWAVVTLIIRACAIAGASLTFLSIDYMRFLGLKQVWAYLTDATLPLPAEPLQRAGMYALSRHPLYLWSLIILWVAPSMSMNGLAFNIASTAYFGLGSLMEERRLLGVFGSDYRSYQREVPWLIPALRIKK